MGTSTRKVGMVQMVAGPASVEHPEEHRAGT
jgi:hypothetical protein